jgi:hypothetical protein
MMLDHLLDDCVDWRESARAVTDAYVRRSVASGPERAVLFAAYTATLDQEQKTAAAYAERATDVECWPRRSDYPLSLRGWRDGHETESQLRQPVRELCA